MIAELVIQFLAALVFGTRRKTFARPRQLPPPREPGEKEVIVNGGAMHERAAEYRAWAAEHGLAFSRARGRDYAGTYRGVAIELVTGLFDTPLPRAPSLTLAVEDPPLDAIRGIAGVWQVRPGEGNVCVRFDPFIEAAVLDRVLATVTPTTGYRD